MVTAGLAIYDTMQFLSCDITTYCVGQAASMGAVLLAAGAAGKRFALPHSRIMIHQPLGGAQGQATDIQIQAEEILRIKQILNGILATHCKRSLEDLERDTDRDNFMSATEAATYGLVDEVVISKLSRYICPSHLNILSALSVARRKRGRATYRRSRRVYLQRVYSVVQFPSRH